MSRSYLGSLWVEERWLRERCHLLASENGFRGVLAGSVQAEGCQSQDLQATPKSSQARQWQYRKWEDASMLCSKKLCCDFLAVFMFAARAGQPETASPD